MEERICEKSRFYAKSTVKREGVVDGWSGEAMAEDNATDVGRRDQPTKR